MRKPSMRILAVLTLSTLVAALSPGLAGASEAPPPPAWVRGVEIESTIVSLYWASSVDVGSSGEGIDPVVAFRVYRSVAGGDFELLAETVASAHVDLLAPQSGPVVYGVTAVSFRGFESLPVYYPTSGTGDGGSCVQASSRSVYVSTECMN